MTCIFWKLAFKTCTFLENETDLDLVYPWTIPRAISWGRHSQAISPMISQSHSQSHSPSHSLEPFLQPFPKPFPEPFPKPFPEPFSEPFSKPFPKPFSKPFPSHSPNCSSSYSPSHPLCYFHSHFLSHSLSHFKNHSQSHFLSLSQSNSPNHFPSYKLIRLFPITPFQMLNFQQSLPCYIGLLTIKVPKAPLYPVSKSHRHPKSLNKRPLNEPAIIYEKFWPCNRQKFLTIHLIFLGGQYWTFQKHNHIVVFFDKYF